mmetsp:Transcript_17578/g.52628  ORF Transcript_17578/g.52628 Transcript_17578/m.52628 type:complete len:203 (-) Transcript_17578:795-1403(-)
MEFLVDPSQSNAIVIDSFLHLGSRFNIAIRQRFDVADQSIGFCLEVVDLLVKRHILQGGQRLLYIRLKIRQTFARGSRWVLANLLSDTLLEQMKTMAQVSGTNTIRWWKLQHEHGHLLDERLVLTQANGEHLGEGRQRKQDTGLCFFQSHGVRLTTVHGSCCWRWRSICSEGGGRRLRHRVQRCRAGRGEAPGCAGLGGGGV